MFRIKWHRTAIWYKSSLVLAEVRKLQCMGVRVKDVQELVEEVSCRVVDMEVDLKGPLANVGPTTKQRGPQGNDGVPLRDCIGMCANRNAPQVLVV